VREKAVAVRRTSASDEPSIRKFRRPSVDVVQRAALRVLGRDGRHFRSQRELRSALLPVLQREDALYRLGGARLRRTLIGLPGLRLTVRYAETGSRRPLQRCPVCFSKLQPIRNRTLYGDEVVLGYECTHCAYWTHLRRRVPIRYGFSTGGSVTETS